MELLRIAEKTFESRLFTGTGKFSSNSVMEAALLASGTELVTVALRRVDVDGAMRRKQDDGAQRRKQDDGALAGHEDDMLRYLRHPSFNLLPNTSGVRNAREAIYAAHLAREALGTNWLKLEIHPDPRYLMPDAVETLNAARELVREGFVVLPYVHADPVLCKQLEEAGCAAVMPLGSPIGSNRGLQSRAFLEIIIEQAGVPVIVDAGIGRPSDAALALEMGADAVLVNTAIAVAPDPVRMADAFRLAVMAGRLAYEAGVPAERLHAEASSPLTAFLDA